MSKSTQPARQVADGMFAGGSILSAIGAVIGASCCVLPLLLVQIGLGSAVVAHLAIFAKAKPILLWVTAALVVLAFAAAFRGGRRPRPAILALLVGSGLLVLISLGLPYVEADIIQWLRTR